MWSTLKAKKFLLYEQVLSVYLKIEPCLKRRVNDIVASPKSISSYFNLAIHKSLSLFWSYTFMSRYTHATIPHPAPTHTYYPPTPRNKKDEPLQ